MNDDTTLSLKKMEFIQKIVSERSLDTLCTWMDMYDEARFVAAMDSEEDELKTERLETMKKFKLKGWIKTIRLTPQSLSDLTT